MNIDYVHSNMAESPAKDFYELRKVVNENWQSKVKNQNSDIPLLRGHAEKIYSTINSLDYEIACMPIIIKNTKSMSSWERRVYLSIVEALVLGFRSQLSNELLVPLIYGIISKAGNIASLRKYQSVLLAMLDSKRIKLSKKLYLKRQQIQKLLIMQRSYESSVFRIFKKGKLQELKLSISKKTANAAKLESALKRYDNFISKLGETGAEG